MDGGWVRRRWLQQANSTVKVSRMAHLLNRSEGSLAAIASISFTTSPPMLCDTNSTGRCPTPAAASLCSSRTAVWVRGNDSPCRMEKRGREVGGWVGSLCSSLPAVWDRGKDLPCKMKMGGGGDGVRLL